VTNPHTVITVKCASCQTIKQEANHWFVASTIHGKFISEPMETWGELAATDLPLCGEACAQKEFGKWLAKIKNGK